MSKERGDETEGLGRQREEDEGSQLAHFSDIRETAHKRVENEEMVEEM